MYGIIKQSFVLAIYSAKTQFGDFPKKLDYTKTNKSIFLGRTVSFIKIVGSCISYFTNMKLSLIRHGMAPHKNVNFRLIAQIQCCETACLHIWENFLSLFDLKDMCNKYKSYFLLVTRMTTSFLYNSKHSRLHMHFDHSSRNRNSAF